MQHHRRSLTRVLGPALLLAAGLALSSRDAYAADPGLAHVDGYLTANGGCLMLRQHDGRMVALVGDARGLLGGDHVRLEGRFSPDPGCGATGFDVALVQTLWGDDYHRTTRYDHLSGEPFLRFAERDGRLDQGQRYEAERRGYQTDRGEYERDRRGYENERRADAGAGRADDRSYRDDRSDRSYRGDRGEADARDRDRYDQRPERPDRYGRYVYEGPHRRVTFVGKIHEAAGACPTLVTDHAVFALDGNLGDYQAGDRVRVRGVLYDGDPNAPCGGPTVVITGIRGH
jgi:hypothetical protein